MIKTIALWLFLPFGRGNYHYNRVQRISIPFIIIGAVIALILKLSGSEGETPFGIIFFVLVGVALAIFLIGTIVGLPLAGKLGDRIQKTALDAMTKCFDSDSAPYLCHVEGSNSVFELGDNFNDAAFRVRLIALDHRKSSLVILSMLNKRFIMIPYNWGWDYTVSEIGDMDGGETS